MLTAQQHLQREWLNARFHALELAAILDRVDRADAQAAGDPKYRQILDLVSLLQSPPAHGSRTSAMLAALGDRPAQ